MTTKKETVERKQRIPVSGPRDILTIADKDPNYVYRWVKDLPGRIQRFLDAGYEIVNHEATVGQRAVDSGSRVGTAVTRLDGGNTLVAMRQLREWYNEDQEAKQTQLNAMEDALRGEGVSTSRDSKWQPGEAEFATKKNR
jgi:hypothetical protein